MTGNVKVTMKKKMGICIWVGCMILIVAALCLCLMAVGRDSVYIDGTFVQHSGDSAEAFLDRRHRRRRQHYDTDGLSETQPDHAGT